MERGHFTEEELQIAKSADLTQVASALGYTVRKIGKYHTLKEMDSIRIYNRSNWFRWSRQYEKGNNGGSQIDFLRVFGGMEVKEAVFWLLDFVGYTRGETAFLKPLRCQVQQREKTEKKAFILPPKAADNRYLYGYLQKERGISKTVIDLFITKDLIYESSPYHNIVFKGNDRKGITRFASMRGVFDKPGKVFKCDVEGNDKRFGFQLREPGSRELVVFEGAIDLMSYVEMKIIAQAQMDQEAEAQMENLLALGMVSDAPLSTFLEENPHVNTIKFALDNDGPGKRAAKELMEKYCDMGYLVKDLSPPEEYKDYNEWLLSCKNHSRNLSGERQESQEEKCRIK